jgi:agmatine deiminase
MEAARGAFARVAHAIRRFEPVTMVVRPEDMAGAMAALAADIAVLAMPLDDSWMRDVGPSFVVDAGGRLAGIHWRFNGWGGKHLPHEKDAALAAGILAHLRLPRHEAPMVLEGGAIAVDGEGTALATEQCLLNPNRNPGMTRGDMEEALHAYLGVRKVIWLGEGLPEDETDGHVDNVACFAGPGTVLLAVADDGADPYAGVAADNRRRLASARDAGGGAVTVVPVPTPEPRPDAKGRRLPMSYLNFYLANGGVVVPAFGSPRDGAALDAIARAFPGRRAVQVPALDIVRGGGGIHCITREQPAPA